MGNSCVNAISSDRSLTPSSSSSSSSHVTMNNTKRFAAVSPSYSKQSPFTFVLPLATHSNLGALYILGAELGRGRSGIIRSCNSRSSGAPFACKSISKLHLRTTNDIEDVVREVRIMKHLSNPVCSSHDSTNHLSPAQSQLGSIVRLHDVIEDKAFVHLIMELCHGGELFDRIVKKKCYPEAHAAVLMKSLLETVQFCHRMGIMHRDIKPENILFVEDSDTSPIKLADFGLALEFSPGQKFSGMAGSAYYIAPEVLQGEYSEEVDMWSSGVIMYGLLSGVPPFRGATEQRIFKAIQGGQLSFPPDLWGKISASAKDMIAQLLHPEAKLRLTPAQALKHPWILKHSTKDAKHIQLSSTSANLAAPRFAGSGGLQTSKFARSTHHSTSTQTISLQAEMSKPELNKFLVDVIVARMDRKTVSASDSLLDVVGKKLENGWTCTLLSLNGNEETLVVDVGAQVKYLVSHDRASRRIGWKLMKEKSDASIKVHSAS